jgi:hypothetical protein
MAKRNYWHIENDKIKIGIAEFKWEPGMSISQRRKSCVNLHQVLYEKFNSLPLDISSASTTELGVKLSAFNLFWKGKTVECWYQGSKVYEGIGPMHKLYDVSSLEAKKSMKIMADKKLIGFNLQGVEYPLSPKTVFYDWIYLQGMVETFGINLDLNDFEYFTDIQAVIDIDACQARAVCEYKLLQKQGFLDKIEDFESFIKWHKIYVEG